MATSKWTLRFIGPMVLAMSGATFAQTTLTAAVNLAVQNSPDVAVDASHRLSVDAALRAAKGGYLPRVDANLGAGREYADNSNSLARGSQWLTRKEASITASQMIFDSFATRNEVRRNEARVDSSAYRVSGTSEQIALKTVEAYLDVLRLQETVRLTKANLVSHEKTYDQIKLRADSGVGRKADQDQALARLALAKANMVSSEANLRDAEINYMRYTGVSPDKLVKPEGPQADLMPKNSAEAFEKAKNRNPLLKMSMADIEAANAQHDAAKSTLGPRVDLEAGINNLENAAGYEGKDDTRYIMLRMRWNLFRGGSDIARIGETKALASEATEVKNRTLRQLDQSVNLSWNTFISVNSRLPNLKLHADSSLLTRDAYVQQFGIGQRTLVDLLDTENEYYQSSVEYNNALHLELFARYRLMADMGVLLESVNVQKRDESTPLTALAATAHEVKPEARANPASQLLAPVNELKPDASAPPQSTAPVAEKKL